MSEENEQPTRQYDVPNTNVSDYPDEAELLLKKMDSDIAADKKNHPYMNGSHPLHDDYVSYRQKLHGAKHAEDELVQTNAEGEVLINQVSPDIAKAMQTALDEKESNTEEIQEKLVAEFEEESAKMDELGFDYAETPDKVLPYQVRGLKEQRLFTEATEKENLNSWEEFKLMIKQDFREMKNTPYALSPQEMEQINKFLEADNANGWLGKQIAETLFRAIFFARKPKTETD